MYRTWNGQNIQLTKYLVHAWKISHKYYNYIINEYTENIYRGIWTGKYLLHKWTRWKRFESSASILFSFSTSLFLSPLLFYLLLSHHHSVPLPLSISLYLCIYMCRNGIDYSENRVSRCCIIVLFFVPFSFLHFLLSLAPWSGIIQSTFTLACSSRS